MLYVVSYSYTPNSAATNHNLCFLKGFSELGIKADYVLIHPDNKHSIWECPYKGISVRYLWNRFRLSTRLLRYFSFYLFVFFTLKKGDIVLLLGSSSFLHSFLKRKGIHIYHERTENPEVVDKNRLFSNKDQYYIDCSKIDGLFVISSALYHYFSAKGVQKEKIHIINMVVDSSRFDGLERVDNNEPYIAYCGTASNNKDGVDELIKAFSIVVNKHPEYRLLIIGRTPSEQQRFENLELVKQLGIEDKVVFTGVIPSGSIPQLLKNASILALDRPDNVQAKFGFPTKLGEYLLTGNPVVITRVGDIPLFLEDGKSAYIAEPQNPHSFAEKICWAIEHPKGARLVGEAGKCVAEECFNYYKETKKIAKVIFK